MSLNAFFQISVSVFCIVATIFMVVLFVWSVVIQNQISRLTKKLEEILETAKTTSNEARGLIERTIKSLEAFKNSILTFDFIRQVVTEITNHLKNNSKGTKDGQTK